MSKEYTLAQPRALVIDHFLDSLHLNPRLTAGLSVGVELCVSIYPSFHQSLHICIFVSSGKSYDLQLYLQLQMQSGLSYLQPHVPPHSLARDAKRIPPRLSLIVLIQQFRPDTLRDGPKPLLYRTSTFSWSGQR
jgi:hypothetical protein